MENNNELTINCSPGTFKKIQADADYRQCVIQQVAGEDTFGQITFSQNEPDMSLSEQPDCAYQQNVDTASGESPDLAKPLWLDAPTRFLIQKVRDLRPRVGKSASLKNKKQMWSTISKELCEMRYMFTAVQVETKFYTLERNYKQAASNNSKTGRTRQFCAYQK
ncbi:uncharacterized protein LOC118755352 [Rhagoletis pomonella]|uniref:uncharacterized protein LOC118755352 n=1 Tax=Rhagoletis pomonella TaxID=28610 RepID=UPI001784AD1F|nr:uncharacterized protein LOC118755352 [Rhagoletis pomonella]